MTNTETTTAAATIDQLVATARKATATLRRLEANDNGSTANLNARERHSATLRGTFDRLNDRGRRDLTGWVCDEDETVTRLAEAKSHGQERPELVARLKSARHALRVANLTTGKFVQQ